MLPQKTFELKIFLAPISTSTALKEECMSWLVAHGRETFVEGIIDDLDIDHNYEHPNQDFYEELGGKEAALILYDYNKEVLDDIKNKMKSHFGEKLRFEEGSIETTEWSEGWKDSFKPIFTDKFCIHPPWDEPKSCIQEKVSIEPGMAFGTGQHATTQICVKALEKYAHSEQTTSQSVMDVGTGSGILAIVAKRLGFGSVTGSDIDHAAIQSAKENAKTNHIEAEFWQGSSCPMDQSTNPHAPFDLVIANILAVVLKKIIPELSSITKEGGHLMMSGLLETDEKEIMELSQTEGFELIDRSLLSDWVCLVLRKNK